MFTKTASIRSQILISESVLVRYNDPQKKGFLTKSPEFKDRYCEFVKYPDYAVITIFKVKNNRIIRNDPYLQIALSKSTVINIIGDDKFSLNNNLNITFKFSNSSSRLNWIEKIKSLRETKENPTPDQAVQIDDVLNEDVVLDNTLDGDNLEDNHIEENNNIEDKNIEDKNIDNIIGDIIEDIKNDNNEYPAQNIDKSDEVIIPKDNNKLENTIESTEVNLVPSISSFIPIQKDIKKEEIISNTEIFEDSISQKVFSEIPDDLNNNPLSSNSLPVRARGNHLSLNSQIGEALIPARKDKRRERIDFILPLQHEEESSSNLFSESKSNPSHSLPVDHSELMDPIEFHSPEKTMFSSSKNYSTPFTKQEQSQKSIKTTPSLRPPQLLKEMKLVDLMSNDISDDKLVYPSNFSNSTSRNQSDSNVKISTIPLNFLQDNLRETTTVAILKNEIEALLAMNDQLNSALEKSEEIRMKEIEGAVDEIANLQHQLTQSIIERNLLIEKYKDEAKILIDNEQLARANRENIETMKNLEQKVSLLETNLSKEIESKMSLNYEAEEIKFKFVILQEEQNKAIASIDELQSVTKQQSNENNRLQSLNEQFKETLKQKDGQLLELSESNRHYIEQMKIKEQLESSFHMSQERLLTAQQQLKQQEAILQQNQLKQQQDSQSILRLESLVQEQKAFIQELSSTKEQHEILKGTFEIQQLQYQNLQRDFQDLQELHSSTVQDLKRQEQLLSNSQQDWKHQEEEYNNNIQLKNQSIEEFKDQLHRYKIDYSHLENEKLILTRRIDLIKEQHQNVSHSEQQWQSKYQYAEQDYQQQINDLQQNNSQTKQSLQETIAKYSSLQKQYEEMLSTHQEESSTLQSLYNQSQSELQELQIQYQALKLESIQSRESLKAHQETWAIEKKTFNITQQEYLRKIEQLTKESQTFQDLVQNKDSMILSLENDMVTNKTFIQSLKDETEVIQELNKSLDQEKKELFSTKQMLEHQLQEALNQIQSFTEDQIKSNKLITELQTNLLQQSIEISSLQHDNDDIKRQYQILQQEQSHSLLTNQSQTQALAQSQSLQEQWQKENLFLQDNVTSLKQTILKLTNEHYQSSQENIHFKEQLQDKDQIVHSLQDQIQHMKEEKQSLKQQVFTLENKNEELLHKNQELTQLKDYLEKQIKDVKATNNSLQEKNLDLRKTIEDLQQELNATIVTNQTNEALIEQLQKKLIVQEEEIKRKNQDILLYIQQLKDSQDLILQKEEKLKQSLNKLENEIKQKDEFIKNIEIVEKDKLQIISQFNDLKKQLEISENQNNVLTTNNSELQIEKEHLSKELQGVKSQYRDSLIISDEKTQEIKDLTQKMETMISKHILQENQAIFNQNEEKFQKEIGRLSDQIREIQDQTLTISEKNQYYEQSFLKIQISLMNISTVQSPASQSKGLKSSHSQKSSLPSEELDIVWISQQFDSFVKDFKIYQKYSDKRLWSLAQFLPDPEEKDQEEDFNRIGHAGNSLVSLIKDLKQYLDCWEQLSTQVPDYMKELEQNTIESLRHFLIRIDPFETTFQQKLIEIKQNKNQIKNLQNEINHIKEELQELEQSSSSQINESNKKIRDLQETLQSESLAWEEKEEEYRGRIQSMQYEHTEALQSQKRSLESHYESLISSQRLKYECDYQDLVENSQNKEKEWNEQFEIIQEQHHQLQQIHSEQEQQLIQKDKEIKQLCEELYLLQNKIKIKSQDVSSLSEQIQTLELNVAKESRQKMELERNLRKTLLSNNNKAFSVKSTPLPLSTPTIRSFLHNQPSKIHSNINNSWDSNSKALDSANNTLNISPIQPIIESIPEPKKFSPRKSQVDKAFKENKRSNGLNQSYHQSLGNALKDELSRQQTQTSKGPSKSFSYNLRDALDSSDDKPHKPSKQTPILQKVNKSLSKSMNRSSYYDDDFDGQSESEIIEEDIERSGDSSDIDHLKLRASSRPTLETMISDDDEEENDQRNNKFHSQRKSNLKEKDPKKIGRSLNLRDLI